MKRNMGGVDRAIRALLGVVILALGLSRGAWWGWIGIIPLGTALVGWCPGYVPLGLSTCRTRTPPA